ncbi:MAG: hypothetical protein M3Q23_16840 [Actinomycetota bacterium]|nr:hypothetical protein [Actinomycetota bacterium]
MEGVTMGEPPVGAREGLPETDAATDAGARRERALRKVGAGADPAWLDEVSAFTETTS